MRCMADHVQLSPLRLSFDVTSIAIINLLRHSPLESRDITEAVSTADESGAFICHTEKAETVLPQSNKRLASPISKENAIQPLTEWHFTTPLKTPTP